MLVPGLVRPREGGGYEMIAGHRRHRVSELAERDTMPVIIRDLDDDAATIIMVDSNIQRKTLFPSERALAHRMNVEVGKTILSEQKPSFTDAETILPAEKPSVEDALSGLGFKAKTVSHI